MTSDYPPSRRAEPRRRVLPWLVGVATLALVVMIGVIIYYGSEDPQRSPTADPSTPSGSQEPPQSPSGSPTPTAEEMEAFASDYVATAASDPAAGFEMLTEEFQAASGGFEGYTGFWGGVSNAEVLSVSADAGNPDDLVVSYTYRYNLQGAGNRTEEVSLRLVYQDGEYLIAGEA